MPKFSVDLLLDNDFLDPAQERSVRKLIKYKLDRSWCIDENDFMEQTIKITYSLKGHEPRDYEFEKKDLETLRVRAYRVIMWDLIKANALNIEGPLVNEIMKSLHSGIKVGREEDYQRDFQFKNKSFKSPSYPSIKTRYLYQTLKLMLVVP